MVHTRSEQQETKSAIMYLYEPPSNCRDIPKSPVSEWGLSASCTCLLPHSEYGIANR